VLKGIRISPKIRAFPSVTVFQTLEMENFAMARPPCAIKLAFRDADTDTDILTRIFADTSDARFPEVIPWQA